MDVVTGATGHVGNNLVRELLARGRRTIRDLFCWFAELGVVPTFAASGRAG